MNDRLIITMPLTPYENMSVGKMTTPILAEALSKSMNSKFVISINTLCSYEKRCETSFIKLMQEYNIIPNDYFIDSYNIDKLLNNINYLIENHYIYEKEKSIMKCKCGKVEIATEYLNSINMEDSLFKIENGKCFCKFCKSECSVTKNKVLIFDSKLVDKSNMKFYPSFINNDKKTFDNTVGQNDIVISKIRSTPIKLDYNNSIYNIDVDFVWEVFLSLFTEKDKIVLCCNHQLYQLYIVGMLEKCFNKDSNTVCLATPYLHRNEKEKELENRIISLKLFSLLSQKWSKKENEFDTTLLNYINTMNVKKKQLLFDIVSEEIETTDAIELDLNNLIRKKYNFQLANEELKRRRKNV